ncbi:MAG: MraY family glycosyltransferase [Nitrospinaceae bacterium]
MFAATPIAERSYLIGFIAALLLSLGLTYLVVRVLSTTNRLGVFVRRRRFSGKRSAVTFGGLPVVLAFLIVLWSLYFLEYLPANNLALLSVTTLGAVLMLGLGLADDLLNIRPRTKLAWQVGIVILLYTLGFRVDKIGGWLDLGQWGFVLTCLWVVGITNSLNLIDGQDGLAGGVILLSALTLFFFYQERVIFQAPLLAVVLGGGVLGFLVFNLPPAKITLGDTGSLPLGLLLSLITILPFCQGYSDEIFYLLPITTLIIPMADTAMAILRRTLRGQNPFAKDTEHFHHKLRKIGLSPAQSIWVLFAVALYFDLLTLIPAYDINLIPKLIPVFFLVVFGQTTLLILGLRRLEVNAQREWIRRAWSPQLNVIRQGPEPRKGAAPLPVRGLPDRALPQGVRLKK